MSINETSKFSTSMNAIDHHVVFVGGTTAVTKVADTGIGMTVTYSGTGLVDLAWADNPGLLINFQAGLQATTPAALKGYTVTCGVPSYSTTTGVTTLRLNIWNSSFALADLAALQWLHVTCVFKRSGTGV